MRRARASYEHCLVTGASAGLGAHFARALAARAELLTLVARRGGRLEALARELSERCPALRCELVVQDLGAEDGVGTLVAEIRRRALPPVHLLVNNAGFGRLGAFRAFPVDDYRQMCAVNMRAAMELLYHLFPELEAGPGRGVINVASAAAFQPVPYFACYSATKAFLRSLSTALAAETRRTGTRVLALCPGPVETEFAHVASLRDGFAKPAARAERVVAQALQAYERGRIEFVPGVLNRLLAYSARFVPLRGLLALSKVVVERRVGRV